jgi:GST-like protein
MLDLYTWRTPNGRKPAIMLAELELPYELHPVDLQQNDQKKPEYLALNPNGKIPALVDRDGPGGERVVIFESGAILLYLAELSGKLLPKDAQGRNEAIAWTFWQVGGPGPFFGQMGKFGRQKPRNEEVFKGFLEESQRLVRVLDGRLKDREYIAGEYSIADIACYPWFAPIADAFPEAMEGAGEVRKWIERVAARPAVQRGMKVTEEKAAT